jgi:hypothetical protein
MLMMGSAHTINVEAVVFVLDEILPGTSAYVSIRSAMRSAYVSIRQHTSACVSVRQHTSAHTFNVEAVVFELDEILPGPRAAGVPEA